MRRTLAKLANYLLLTVLALLFIAPIWFMLITSFKPNNLAVRDMGSIWAFVPRISSPQLPAPEGWTFFTNYINIFNRVEILRTTLNSFIIVGGVILGRLAFDSMCAYSLARLRWRGQKVVLGTVISLIIIPFEVIAIPLLLMVNRLGWINSYQVQIVPFMSSPLAIYLFYQFFLNFPTEIEEASRIDGASFFRTFTTIVVPSAKPVFATVAILGFLDLWGAFLWPLITTRDVSFRPVMLGLFFFFQQDRSWGYIMAYASLITVPVLLFFLALQKWFVQSVVSSGLKG